MFRIVALNEEEKIREDLEESAIASDEVQDVIVENEYIRALLLKSNGKIKPALLLFKELLDTKILNEFTSNNRCEKLWNIRYNCHKNIAMIYENEKKFEMALNYYQLSMQMDDSDVYTMHRFGQLALKLNFLELAEYAFENCLKYNHLHWKAANGFLKTLCLRHNVIGAYGCALKLHKQNPFYQPAIKILREVQSRFKHSIFFYQNFWPISLSISLKSEIESKNSNVFPIDNVETTETVLETKPNLEKFRLTVLSWHSIGSYLNAVNEYLKEENMNNIFNMSYKDIICDNTILEDKENVQLDCGNKIDCKTLNEENINCDIDDINGGYSMSRSDGASNFLLPSSDEVNKNQSDENHENMESIDVSKPKPRRRCSDLHFLEQWGWHKNRRYSRKKTQPDRVEVDTSLNGFLRRTFSKFMEPSFENAWPFAIIGEGTSITDDSYSQCKNCKPIISIQEFQENTQSHFDGFCNFLKKNNFDLILLIYKWLKYISIYWNKRLPTEICDTYLTLFNIFKDHYDFSTWNQLSNTTFEAFYRIYLLFLELQYNNNFKDNNENELWKNIFNHLLLNSGNAWIAFEENFHIYKMRLIHAEYLWNIHLNELENCVNCLKCLEELLEEQVEDYTIHFPNISAMCLTKHFLSRKRMELQRQISLSKIPKMFEEEKWLELSNIIMENISYSRDRHDNEDWANDFKTQIEILLQCLWNLGMFEDCLIWSEKFLHYTANRYLNSRQISSHKRIWSDSINFLMSYIEALIQNEGYDSVSRLKEFLSRLLQNIIRLLSYQLDAPFDKNYNPIHDLETRRPWVILHQILCREEHLVPVEIKSKSLESEEDEDLIPSSFLLLFTAHEFLGKRFWCTRDNGELLRYIIDNVTLNLRAPLYDCCRDLVYEYLEQVTYCLYGYPQKKPRSRHLEDHEAAPVELSWPNAIQLFDLYRPENLPEFNSYKLESISADMEQLLLKAITLMPIKLDPTPFTSQITTFISGDNMILPDETFCSQWPYKIKTIYYLLADYYFKNRDFSKTIKYYTLDLTINPERFDSWAGMALSKASKIETKLNSLLLVSIKDLLKECDDTIRCFEQCIYLNKNQVLLWIEYGSFAYTIHSFCSRELKKSLENLTKDEHLLIVEEKERMLNIAYNCFSLASTLQNIGIEQIEENDDYHDEKWLCQFMLGKMAEKRKEHPKVYLNYYLMAAKFLYENNATYPIKINHSNPTTLSVEALEVFYRTNVAILKYLHNNECIDSNTGGLLNGVLLNLSNSPFAFNKAKIDGNSLNALKRKTIDKSELSVPQIKIVKQDVNNTLEEKNINKENNSDQNKKNNLVIPASTAQSPLRRESQESAATGTTTTVTSGSTTSDSSSSASDSDSEESTENDSKKYDKCDIYNAEKLKDIYKKVIRNIEECVTRFPEHYKSIYRLIWHFINSPSNICDLNKCENLLLGQYGTTLGNQVNGLFYDRKNNNLFNGIWRIPSSEIDRPGSFSAHLVKCVEILLNYLKKTNNHKLLIDFGLQLYRTPDQDKRYVKDSERIDLYQKSINSCAQIMRNMLQNNMKERNDVEVLNMLLDIYKIYKKCLKYINHKEPMFTQLLIDVYKFYISDKIDHIPNGLNFLDLAIKLCLQEIGVRKSVEKTNTTGIMSSTNLGDAIIGLNNSNAPVRPIQIPGLPIRGRPRQPVKIYGNAICDINESMDNTVPVSFPTTTLSTDLLQPSNLMAPMSSLSALTSFPQGTIDFQSLVSEYCKKLFVDRETQPNIFNKHLPTHIMPVSLATSLPIETSITPSTANSYIKLPQKNESEMQMIPHNSDITITPCEWKPSTPMSTLSQNILPVLPTKSSVSINMFTRDESTVMPSKLLQPFINISDKKVAPQASYAQSSMTTTISMASIESSIKSVPTSVHMDKFVKNPSKPKNSFKTKQTSTKPYSRTTNIYPEMTNSNMINPDNFKPMGLINKYDDIMKNTPFENSTNMSPQCPRSTTRTTTSESRMNTQPVMSSSASFTLTPIPSHTIMSQQNTIQSPFAFSTYDSITMTPLPISISGTRTITTETTNNSQQGGSNYHMEMSSKTLQQKLADRQKANKLNEFKTVSAQSGKSPNVDVIILD